MGGGSLLLVSLNQTTFFVVLLLGLWLLLGCDNIEIANLETSNILIRRRIKVSYFVISICTTPGE